MSIDESMAELVEQTHRVVDRIALAHAAVQIAAGIASSGSWSVPHYGSGDSGESYEKYRTFIANESVLLAKAVLAKCGEG